MRRLVTWLGRTDLRCSAGDLEGAGPIASAAADLPLDRICILSNYSQAESLPYVDWLRTQAPGVDVELRLVALSSPIDYGAIYQAVVAIVDELIAAEPDAQLSFHLSPGTPAMSAVWIILGKTRYPATLIESSLEQGVRVADVPFDIAADFKPDRGLLTSALIARARGLDESTAFDRIVGESQVVREAVARAQLAATQNFPVLILGESGTGKELFARAIHTASRCNSGPFVSINCGAIPENLLESELFGHEKGAFTGASATKQGCLERADGGTLFLDELGELPLTAQVSLLRALQEKCIVRVGGSEEIAVTVRVVAATNRDLTAMVAAGEFRSDLYYRLAVVLLQLPPLRRRGSDLVALARHLLDQINAECQQLGNWDCKRLSVAAINIIKRHSWHGNVRELDNTLRRAAIWSAESAINGEEMQSALSHLPCADNDVLNRPLGDGFSLDETLAEVDRNYLQRGIEQAHGNKSEAARLLGLNNHQTLSNRLKKHGIA